MHQRRSAHFLSLVEPQKAQPNPTPLNAAVCQQGLLQSRPQPRQDASPFVQPLDLRARPALTRYLGFESSPPQQQAGGAQHRDGWHFGSNGLCSPPRDHSFGVFLFGKLRE
ncbi:hypothetical protein CsSME_00004379 [Camellia sinensis var. sinensis]